MTDKTTISTPPSNWASQAWQTLPSNLRENSDLKEWVENIVKIREGEVIRELRSELAIEKEKAARNSTSMQAMVEHLHQQLIDEQRMASFRYVIIYSKWPIVLITALSSEPMDIFHNAPDRGFASAPSQNKTLVGGTVSSSG